MSDPRSSRGEIVVHNDILASGYTQIPNPILECPDLTIGAKITYGILLRLHWAAQGYPGHEETAGLVGCSRASLCRYLAQLQEANLVSSARESYGATNTYHILDWREATVQLRVRRRSPDMRRKPSNGETVAVQDSDENGVKAVDSVLDLESEADSALVACAERLLAMAPEEELSSVVAHLKYFPVDQVEEATATTEAVAQEKELRKPIAYCYAILGNAKKVREHREAEAATTEKKSRVQWLTERAGLMLGMAKTLVQDWPADQVKAILLDSYGHDPQTVADADLCIKEALAPVEDPAS